MLKNKMEGVTLFECYFHSLIEQEMRSLVVGSVVFLVGFLFVFTIDQANFRGALGVARFSYFYVWSRIFTAVLIFGTVFFYRYISIFIILKSYNYNEDEFVPKGNHYTMITDRLKPL